MKLYLKQHVFTFGDRFTIYDADGNERFYVEGEVFTMGKRLHLYNAREEEIALIHQKLFSFQPTYLINRGGEDVAVVVKEFTFFKQTYTIKGPNWTVEGDFLNHEYTIFDGDHPIVVVTREYFTFGDAYEIDIKDGIDGVTALATALVIDAVLAD